MRTLLEQQYAALADWLDEVPVSAHLVEPVGLGDWTVRELVAHLGLGIGLSRYVAAAEPGAVPLSLGEYVRAYPPASDQIAEMTREISARFGDDLVGGFRRTAAEAFEAIDAIPGEVFQARRGPIARDDYLLTRLLELVVHGDDLQRALGRTDAPLLPAAVTAVSDALAAAYVERAGSARPARPAWSGSVEPPAGCRPTTRTCRCSDPYAAVMPTIHFTVTTTSTPEQFVAGLTDFGPGRQEMFANSADSALQVHDQGPGHADVTEGSVGIWERLAYDWSDPDRIVLTTTDSNVFGGRSGHTYTLTRRHGRDHGGGRRRGS